jgi:hypothetical protein
MSGVSGVSFGDAATVTPPILNGNMHCQQTSVTGLWVLDTQMACAAIGKQANQTSDHRKILLLFE